MKKIFYIPRTGFIWFFFIRMIIILYNYYTLMMPMLVFHKSMHFYEGVMKTCIGGYTNVYCAKPHNVFFQNVILCTSSRLFTAMLWYIERTFHARMLYRILNKAKTKQTKKQNKTKQKISVIYDNLDKFSVTLTLVSIVITMCS